MPQEFIASSSIQALDATPVGIVSAGQGAKSYNCDVDDFSLPTAGGLGSIGSFYRLLRIPTNALVQSLYIATDKALDSNAANTLAFDINVAFSDSLLDGTRQDLVGTVPTTANNGTVTTFAAYASPNKLFGTVTAAQMGHTAAFFSNNILFQGIGGVYTLGAIASTPLWNLFGFVDGRGFPENPGGMFDIVAYVVTAAATGVSGSLWARCEYVT